MKLNLKDDEDMLTERRYIIRRTERHEDVPPHVPERRTGYGLRASDGLAERFAELSGRFEMMMKILVWVGTALGAIGTAAVTILVAYFTGKH